MIPVTNSQMDLINICFRMISKEYKEIIVPMLLPIIDLTTLSIIPSYSCKSADCFVLVRLSMRLTKDIILDLSFQEMDMEKSVTA